MDAAEFGLGVVDERAELGLLVHGELELEGRLDALADDARAVVEDVLEGLVLAVDVRDEVLGALRQVEDGLEVDDLGVDGLGRRELLRKKLEILEVLVAPDRWIRHRCSPLSFSPCLHYRVRGQDLEHGIGIAHKSLAGKGDRLLFQVLYSDDSASGGQETTTEKPVRATRPRRRVTLPTGERPTSAGKGSSRTRRHKEGAYREEPCA